MFGPFDDAQKFRLLSEADLYLNPVVLGSGTSLKALEALGAAIPMVSTAQGASAVLPSQPVFIARSVRGRKFALAVQELLVDRGRAEAMAAEGQRYSLKYFSWEAHCLDILQSPGITRLVSNRT